ncbi:ABC transporter substrate-binding protein [Romboutsia sp. 13368]|uniref:ABC transporter substrate-binding protein n=1 Tax=Romboutsia sp. 13368 TaxID=2708053 RepID=UPI0025EEFD5C|nr:ABC transporter substrate-binding protein [Romboutsia sp. 13368]
MKLKKILPLALTISLMVGCSGKKQSSTPTNEEIVTEIKNPVEITFWHAMNGDQEAALQGFADNFTKENPNIKITLQNQSSYQDLQQKITATTASPKDLPTITQAYPDWLLNAIDENLVLDLKPYIENETLKFDNYDDILKGFREASTIDDKIYGIPFNKSTEVLWYNKTLFDKLGLKVPTTYDEFADVAEQIKEKQNIVGGGFDSLSNYYSTYLKNEGVTFDSKLDPTSEASEDAVDYYLDGIKDGYFRIAGTDKYLSGPFGNETLAMYVGSNAGEAFIKEGVNNKFEIGVAPYPAKQVMQQGTDLFIFNNATNEQKTAAYQFLKYLTTKENQITWAEETGYIPVRESAINSDEYKNSGSLIAPIIGDATKNLFTNPLVKGMDSAFRESNTVLESILADPNGDVKSKLESFKSTLMSTFE